MEFQNQGEQEELIFVKKQGQGSRVGIERGVVGVAPCLGLSPKKPDFR